MFSTIKQELIKFRHMGHFYKAKLEEAVVREKSLKDALTQKTKANAELHAGNTRLSERIQELESQLKELRKNLYGRKTEKSTSQSSLEVQDEKKGKKRGKVPGSAGHGRKRREELPVTEVDLDLPADEKVCPCCGLPYAETTRTEDSEEIVIETVKVYRRKYKRKVYRKTCQCPSALPFKTAEKAPKVIPKGLFSAESWVHILTEKYLYQVPVHRIVKRLDLNGLEVSAGTVVGGLKRLEALLTPLWEACRLESLNGLKWHIDETSWRVFESMPGKTGHKWWIWVFVGEGAVCYMVEPSRSGSVLQKFFDKEIRGIVICDRYSAYSKLPEGILIAYCWAHVRRDFVKARDTKDGCRPWGKWYIGKIGKLYHLNKLRLQCEPGSKAWEKAEGRLRKEVSRLEARFKRELSDPKLSETKRKILESLERHWEGLMLFVELPFVPMDNNRAERQLRPQAVARKNYYGSGSVWNARLSSAVWSVFATCELHGVNPQEYLLYWLKQCASNGGKPPEKLEGFLPWDYPQNIRAGPAQEKKAA